ncbi:MAG: hypothetical protein H0X30_17815 [Anaerolineae bacterium]|nr:hypothetical protein [Anaerolineae bacterium]
MDALHKEDQAARNEPTLRLEMVTLIDDLKSLLDDYAAQLATVQGDSGAFNQDITRDLLVWQLAKFLARGFIERDPSEPAICRGWQVTQAHARDFFAVGKDSSNALVALEVSDRP